MKKVMIILVFLLVAGNVFAQVDPTTRFDDLRTCTDADWDNAWASGFGALYGEWQQWATDIPAIGLTPDEVLADGWQILSEISALETPACRELQQYLYYTSLGMITSLGGLAFTAESNVFEPAYRSVPFNERAAQGYAYANEFADVALRVADGVEPITAHGYEQLPDCTPSQLQEMADESIPDYVVTVMEHTDEVEQAGFPTSAEYVVEAWAFYDDLLAMELPQCLEAQKFLYHEQLGLYLSRSLLMLMAEPSFNEPAYNDLSRRDIVELIQGYVFEHIVWGISGIPSGELYSSVQAGRGRSAPPAVPMMSIFEHETLPNCTEQDWDELRESGVLEFRQAWSEWENNLPDELPISDTIVQDAWRIIADFNSLVLPECLEIQQFRYHVGLGSFAKAAGLLVITETIWNELDFESLPFDVILWEATDYYGDSISRATEVIPGEDELTTNTPHYSYDSLPECTAAELQVMSARDLVSILEGWEAWSDEIQDATYPLDGALVAEGWSLYEAFNDFVLPDCLEAQRYLYQWGLGMFLMNSNYMLRTRSAMRSSADLILVFDEIIDVTSVYILDAFTVGLGGVEAISFPESEAEVTSAFSPDLVNPAFAYASLPICTHEDWQAMQGSVIGTLFEDWRAWLGQVVDAADAVSDEMIAEGWKLVESYLTTEWEPCLEAQMYKYHMGQGFYLTTFAITFDQDTALYVPISATPLFDAIFGLGAGLGYEQSTIGDGAFQLVGDVDESEEILTFPYVGLPECNEMDYSEFSGSKASRIIDEWYGLVDELVNETDTPDEERLNDTWLKLVEYSSLELPFCRQVQEHQYQFSLSMYFFNIASSLRPDVIDELPGDATLSADVLIQAGYDFYEQYNKMAMDAIAPALGEDAADA